MKQKCKPNFNHVAVREFNIYLVKNVSIRSLSIRKVINYNQYSKGGFTSMLQCWRTSEERVKWENLIDRSLNKSGLNTEGE